MGELAPEDAVHRTRTVILIAAASILEKCDEQILPALYAWVGAAFQATPTQLGNLALARAMMQALASPLGGVSSALAPRGAVIAAGCLIWATFTALFGTLSSYALAVPVLAMNGLGLALVIPNVQSLTADYYPPGARGRAFGALWLVISLGGMLGALYATNMGAATPLGVPGWRFVFVSVAVASAGVGLANGIWVHDPGYAGRAAAAREAGASLSSTLRAMGAGVLAVAGIPTFLLIITQGIVGSVPYASLIFLTLYLQLAGMSDAHASLLVAAYLAGGGVGGLIGGAVGDLAARLSPGHGRILATQFSVAVGIPFAWVIFRELPMDGSTPTFVLHLIVILLFAMLTAWPGPCCNNPVFAEIVPAAQRNLVYAFDRCFEGAVAAFAAPLVGLLAEKWYGFSGASTVTGNRERDLANARALGSALLAFLAIPWFICLCVYSGLHWTYPEDKRKALKLEMELAELEMRVSGLSWDEAGEDREARRGAAEEQRLLAEEGRQSRPRSPPKPERSARSRIGAATVAAPVQGLARSPRASAANLRGGEGAEAGRAGSLRSWPSAVSL
ncbi:hypothetical protein ACKKBG_A07800 [Auxenochlorella protothecoides x Auxenochlorella symbiontica]